MSKTTAPIRVIAGNYLENLLAGQPQRYASPLAWLTALREEAANCISTLTLPTTRDEEWRFTDISPLINMSFAPALSTNCLEATDVAHFYIEEATTRLVFVDGFYAPQLSSTSKQSGASTFPYIQVLNNSAQVEHEASTSRIGEDQMFYFAQRGVDAEAAVSMIINGFCKDVFQQLPLEFAVEATNLLSFKLEGSVG